MTAETRAFGARLAMARHAAGLTQTELGVKLGRTRSTITNLEAGRCSTTLEQVNVMCRVLDVTAEWLMTGMVTKAPTEIAFTLRKIRSGWQRIIDGNRGLGWPEQADNVQFPSAFVADLNTVIAMLGPDLGDVT